MTDDAGGADLPPSPSSRSRRRPWPRIVTALAGLALVVAGVVTVLVSDTTTYVGSYEPLPEGAEVSVAYQSTFTDGWPLPDGGVLVGLLLVLGGVAVLLVTLGWWISDLRRAPGEQTSTGHASAAPAERPSARPRWPQLTTGAAGLALVVVGLAVHASAPPPSFGWFAYAPLSDTTYFPSTTGPTEVVGGSLVVAGIALLTFTLGWWVGNRRRVTR